MKYKVTGYRLTTVVMTVEGNSESEAIKKAWRGEYNDDVDTEPGGNIYPEQWTADAAR